MLLRRKCKWCGRDYDAYSTAARDGYCSSKCKAEAERSKMEVDRLEMENRKLRQASANSGSSGGSGSGGDGCSPTMIKWGAIVFIVLAIMGMCKGGDEDEKQDKKAAQRTGQVSKTSKQETQTVQKSAKKIEPVAENVQTEEIPQAASEDVSVASSTNEEQVTAQQASEEQVSEEMKEKQIEELPEEVAEETPENTTAEETVFNMVGQMPEFPGGHVELEKYLEDHLQYPEVAQENGTQGRVTVQFVVNTDGSISDAQVVRGLDPSCNGEALRLINSMPRWIPGQQDGKNVRVKYTISVIFKL